MLDKKTNGVNLLLYLVLNWFEENDNWLNLFKFIIDKISLKDVAIVLNSPNYYWNNAHYTLYDYIRGNFCNEDSINKGFYFDQWMEYLKNALKEREGCVFNK